MTSTSDNSTLPSLLLRVRDPQDEDAWREFVSIYAPQVFKWARGRGFQNADADDVTQLVLGRLVRAMQSFEYDPRKGRFRAWLQTVTSNAVRSFAASFRRPDRGVGGSSIGALRSAQGDETFDDLQRVLDRQVELELLAMAESRVRLRVKPDNWEAWRLTSLDGLTPAEAAERLDMSPSVVYVARTRVTKLMKAEIAKLEQTGGQKVGANQPAFDRSAPSSRAGEDEEFTIELQSTVGGANG